MRSRIAMLKALEHRVQNVSSKMMRDEDSGRAEDIHLLTFVR